MFSEKRIKKVIAHLESKKIDCFVTANPSNIFYLTGIYNVEGYLCISKKDMKFFTGGIYYQYAVDRQNVLKIPDFQCEQIKGKNFYAYLKSFKKPSMLSSEISAGRWEQLCQETGRKINLIDNFIARMRMVKDEEEIMKIKKAGKIAYSVLNKVKRLIKPGVSELDIAAEILYQIRKQGGDKEAFGVIVASGINSSYPHHQPSTRKFKDNDIVVIDMGVCLDGYNSDITDTLIIGRIEKEAKHVLFAIKEVHKYVEEKIRTGEKSCKKLHNLAAEIFKKYGLEKFFTHGLGHGVGIDVHEMPQLSPVSRDKLE
ncbi:MAG TPA: Xaa-Pro peptidase family protein, partial [bacterium]|nr:Xaa-Pro peptidase family protein [bacterium]